MTTDWVRSAPASQAAGAYAPAPTEQVEPSRRQPSGQDLPRQLFPVLRRTRVLDRLSNVVSWTPVTVVWAPAGAGKTTLAATWAAHPGSPGDVTWFRLDPRHDDPATTWPRLARAVGPAAASRPVTPPGRRDVDHQDLRDLEVLIIDNAETLTTPLLTELFERVLRDRLGGPRVVLLSRTEPAVPLHRYRLDGSVAELTYDDLAFSTSDARDLFRLHGVAVSPGTARALVERTGGWVAGLRMAALAMQRSATPMSLQDIEACLTPGHNLMADYLVAEVLQPMTPGEKHLLVSTLPYPEIDARLVEEVTGLDDCERLLTELARRHAFVRRVGGRPCSFRVHPLLRKALYAEAGHDAPTTVMAAHRRAGGRADRSPGVQALSAKELEVLRHLAALLTTEEIAAAMFISVNTVKTHVRSILRKLAVSRRYQAVRRARELGLV